MFLLMPYADRTENEDDIGRATRLTILKIRAMIEQSDGVWLREYADLHAAILNGRYPLRR